MQVPADLKNAVLMPDENITDAAPFRVMKLMGTKSIQGMVAGKTATVTVPIHVIEDAGAGYVGLSGTFC